ncbi:hypothetical protein MSBRW_2084 [Methanosarcina barkeri str. Wiesmoor]|uniref:Mobile element protein n=2 Tax=Methanosarcina barkeri TaxID=2208 RepID=A0A0E3QMT4_METBA|nr:hypothetical protein [Methanosarcina barkeri]AKB51337.1 hypothetical protein MSBRW_2084 [Methanosarcina barkeri str. Wiesmoor]
MKTFNVSQIWMEKLSSLKNKIFNDKEMHRKLDCVFSLNEYITTRKKVFETCTTFARGSAALLCGGTGGESKGQKKRCESSNHNRGRNKGK